MKQWANLSRFEVFMQQWDIASDMEEQIRNLEKCVASFKVSFLVCSSSAGANYFQLFT